MNAFRQTLGKLIRAEGQPRSARTVEIFGWIMFAEASILLFIDGLGTLWTFSAWRQENAAD